MDYLHKCHSGHTDCFAYSEYRDGCVALERTRFLNGRDCPFYQPRDTFPNYEQYAEEFLPKRRENK